MSNNLRELIDSAYNRGMLKHGAHEAAINSVTLEMEELLGDLVSTAVEKRKATHLSDIETKNGLVYRWSTGLSRSVKKLLDRKNDSE